MTASLPRADPCRAAWLIRFARSAPENPGVPRATTSKSTPTRTKRVYTITAERSTTYIHVIHVYIYNKNVNGRHSNKSKLYCNTSEHLCSAITLLTYNQASHDFKCGIISWYMYMYITSLTRTEQKEERTLTG